MHIALLSDPLNFHTRKWANALREAGAKVTVFAFGAGSDDLPNTVWLPPRWGRGNGPSYLSYLSGGKELREALQGEKVDVLNSMNVTPFGVWGRQSGFQPHIVTAFGADILEYPPKISQAPHLKTRAWDQVEGQPGPAAQLKYRIARRFYRRQVQLTLNAADLITGDNLHLLERMEGWFGIAPERMRQLIYGVEPEKLEAEPETLASLKKRMGVGEGQRVILSPRGAKAIYQADLILEGFRLALRQGISSHKFILLSAGYEISGQVRQEAKALEQEFPNFRFEEGLLSSAEMGALWSLTDLFISAPVYDGYSNSLADGRYVGAIPLVNAIPANTELIRHKENGWIVEDFRPEAISEAIIEIMGDLAAWKAKFAQGNREWIEAHSLVRKNARMFLEWCAELG